MLDQATLDALAEVVAQRVVDLLEHRPASASLVDAATLAEQLGVDRSWVYEHADELGASRLGEGPKARLRFDLETATACLASRRSERATSRTNKPKQSRRRSRRLGTETPLLPVREARG